MSGNEIEVEVGINACSLFEVLGRRRRQFCPRF